MPRMIVVAKKTGLDERSGIAVKRGEAYEINDHEFDEVVFARPGEDLGEETVNEN